MFTQALYNALTDDGVIVMQLGVTPDLEDISDQYTKSKNRAKLTNGLSSIGFDSMHAYEEVNSGFVSVLFAQSVFFSSTRNSEFSSPCYSFAS